MEFPGTTIHKLILKILLDVFKRDKNVGAFIIFGSLVRGNWDKYSDLDLDVVLKDASKILVKQEAKNVIEKLK